MYYILNETNQIIAADESLLNACGLSHIDELSLKSALGEIKFDTTSETDLTITVDNNEETYSISKSALSSMLGRLTLVTLEAETEVTVTEENTPAMDLESDILSIEPDMEDTIEVPEAAEEENELFDLVLEEKAEETIAPVEDTMDLLSQDTEILDLGLEEKREAVTDDNTPIVIDIDKISQQIGVSHEDYDTFLNEYIDTALDMEQDLKNSDEQIRSNAVATLSHLSDVLQLPVIGEHLEKIAGASSDTQRESVESFYAAISRLTTSQTAQEDHKVDLTDVQEEITEPSSGKGFGTIDLDDVKPIYFDFRLEEAASDLSLPVELIEEFVVDFIQQCHEETPNMLKAYEEGDLETIQKIGHLLKGASSNLRIKNLSDTLYKIQFCEESNDMEQLIKDYWGHFLSFEIQINALAK